MMLFWIPVLLLVPFGIVWMLRRDGELGCSGVTHATHAGAPPTSGHDPIEIARVRLAKGEITLEQFDEIRRVLG